MKSVFDELWFDEEILNFHGIDLEVLKKNS